MILLERFQFVLAPGPILQPGFWPRLGRLARAPQTSFVTSPVSPAPPGTGGGMLRSSPIAQEVT